MISNQDRNKPTGLCMTCNHAGFCVFLARASSTIWCCEEFDDRLPLFEPEKSIRAAKPKSSLKPKSVSAPYVERRVRKAS